MTMELLNFEERSGPAVFEERKRSSTGYKGPERRRSHRRAQRDRRMELRFELDKPDRRTSTGRRATDQRSKFW